MLDEVLALVVVRSGAHWLDIEYSTYTNASLTETTKTLPAFLSLSFPV